MENEDKQFNELVPELKIFMAKANEEITNLGAAKLETIEAIGKVREKLDALQSQADAIDLKVNKARFTEGPGGEEKSVGELFVESEEFRALMANDFLDFRSKNGRFRKALPYGLSRKALITTTSGVTAATTGITVPQRIPGVVVTAQQELRLRDIMRVFELKSGNAFEFIRQTTRTNAASPQTEGSAKAESTYAWDTISDLVATIAHFVNITKQALSDVPWMLAMLNAELMYGLKIKEEAEILSGDNLGTHLNGIITQATAYSTGTYNVSGDTKLDKLRHAKLQARLAGLGTFAPDAYVLHPTDMHAIELLKTEEGGANKGLYIVGDPKAGPQIKLLWGLPVVESDAMTAGTFLVGAFGTAAYIVDRQDAMIELSYEHSDNFTKNIVTVLAEERVGLAVTRPGAFIYGSSY